MDRYLDSTFNQLKKDGYRGFWDVKSHESRDALILYLEDIILSYKRCVECLHQTFDWKYS